MAKPFRQPPAGNLARSRLDRTSLGNYNRPDKLVYWLRVRPTTVPEKPASLAQRGLAFFVDGPLTGSRVGTGQGYCLTIRRDYAIT